MPKNVLSISDLPVIGKQHPQPENREVFQSGCIILADKPLEWTSFDVVKFFRSRIPAKKVGHAGTLDPLASGLLVLCAGRATKSISRIQELPKTYTASIRFGASTPSYDAETEPDQTAPWEHITARAIEETLANKFTGTILQKPPLYSAVRRGGQRLYKLARQGKSVPIEPREVEIYGVDIDRISPPDLYVTVRCGKGTYIRSLAYDLGIALGSRAYLTGLRRNKIGSFHVDDALTPAQFREIYSKT